MNSKKIFRWIKLVIIVYCLPAIALYFLQDYVILHPEKVEAGYEYKFNSPYKELFIDYDKNTKINIIRFFPADTSMKKGVVLYFHGNKKNIGRYQQFAPYFTRAGYEVWMIDYPGFGKSNGTFSEKLAYDLAMMEYTLARKKFQPGNIVIYGKSLGTGIAAYLASVRNCRYLILESPYYSLPSAISHYAPIYPVQRIIHYEFPSYLFLPKVTDPIILIHGTSDWVIPYGQSLRLKPLLKPADVLITVPGGGHNDLFDFPEVPRLIDSVLRR